MPSAQTNCLLHHALETDEDGLGAVVPGDDDLGVTWQDGELLLAAVTTSEARQVREAPAIDRTPYCLQHFRNSTSRNREIDAVGSDN